MPGGSNDKSVWAENHGPRQGTCFLFSKKHSYHPVGTHGFVVCATTEPKQATSHCSGDFLPPAAQKARRVLSLVRSSEVRTQGHPRGSSRSGWKAAPVTPNSWLAGAKCDRLSGLRACPLLRTVNMACPPRSSQGRCWSGHPGGGSSLPWVLTCPVLAPRNRATGLIILCPDQMQTVNYPICCDQNPPDGYVKREISSGSESVNVSKLR